MNKFKLPEVNSRHGAPMGRPPWPLTDYSLFDWNADVFKSKASCFRLKLYDGCYDEGGAYWGGPANLYCATNGFHGDDTFQLFVRAKSRADAIRQFDAISKNKITWSRR